MSRRLFTCQRAAAVVVVLLALVATALLPASAAQAKVGKNGLTVSITSTNAAFSPNGDGSKDLGAVRYRLSKRAYVTVRVSHGTTTVLLRRVGRARAGAHYFVWNGVSNGRVVTDATYSVQIVARKTRHGKAQVAFGALTVDARYSSLGIGSDATLSSTLVYPRTTVIHDVVVGVYKLPVTGLNTSDIRRQVVSADGRVVDSAALDTVPVGLYYAYRWDGRDELGNAVAPGNYRIRLVQGYDAAGNPRVLVPPRSVTVSAQRLKARTTSFSVDAAAATRFPYCDEYFDESACDDTHSPSTASVRFVNGVSYPSVSRTVNSNPPYTFNTTVADDYLVPLTGRSTPYDVFSVTAHGGPTTTGDDATGSLVPPRIDTLRTGADAQSAVTMIGDTAESMVGIPILGMVDPRTPRSVRTYVVDGPPVLQWTFAVPSGSSYDVASFDVTYTRYVPAP